MKKYYCALPFAGYKRAEIRGIYNHNERQEGCYDNNPELDISRKDLNYHIKEPDGYYLDTIRDRMAKLEIKERSNSVLMCEFIISASTEWINAKPESEQKKYLEYGYEFIPERFGEENVISAVVHYDESHPHLHVCMIPITKDGRMNYNDFLGGGRFALSGVIDEFYYHISKVYPEFRRGIPYSKTMRKRIPLYLYRCVDDIYDQHREICTEIGDINLLNLSTQKTVALKDMQSFIENIAKVKNAVKSTDEHIRNMESQIIEKNNEIENLKSRITETSAKLRSAQEEEITLWQEICRSREILSQLTNEEISTLLEKAERERREEITIISDKEIKETHEERTDEDLL